MTMDDWFSSFEKYLKNPEEEEKKNSKLYENAITLLLEPEDKIKFHSKIQILHKLLFVFPKNYELYYYMGFLYKDVDIYQALMWFQMCFNHDDKNVENVLDLVKILIDKEYVKLITYWNKKHNNCLYSFADIRIYLTICSIHLFNSSFKNAKTYINKIIDDNTSQSDIIIYDQVQIYHFFYNIYLLHSRNGDINTAIQWLFTALNTDISNGINFTEELKKLRDNILSGDEFQPFKPIINKPRFKLSTETKTYITTIFLAYDYLYHDTLNRKLFVDTYSPMIFDYTNRYTHIKPIKPTKRFRVGYVSAGFYNDVVNNFISAIVLNHTFDVILYATTEFYNAKTLYMNTEMYDIQNMTTDDAAKLIHSHKLDFLFDLNGYTRMNRLDVFAKQPTPIQISYIGYPNTLGIRELTQYRITDMIADPPDSNQYYTENLCYLNRCFLLFSSILQLQPTISFREKKESDVIYISSLNREQKLNKHVFETWKEILKRTPSNVKFLIKLNSKDDTITDWTTFFMDKFDISSDRLEIVQYCSNEEYVNLFVKSDILLDPFPYSGTTTTCNALYNSTPVITLYDKRYHSHNVSASILHYSGFPEFISYTKEDYINKVVDLCTNPKQIFQYKQRIKPAFIKMMNQGTFIVEYENLLKHIYKTHWGF